MVSELFLIAAALSASAPAVGGPESLAALASASGKIMQIDATTAGNRAFRVYLENEPPMCGNANSWAYVDTDDANYQGFVATLTSAFMGGKTVRIYAEPDTRGHCQIYYVLVTA